jgi:hypothetical protein
MFVLDAMKQAGVQVPGGIIETNAPPTSTTEL